MISWPQNCSLFFLTFFSSQRRSLWRRKKDCRQLLGEISILSAKRCCHLPTIFRFSKENFAKCSCSVCVCDACSDIAGVYISIFATEIWIYCCITIQMKYKPTVFVCEKFMIGRYVNGVVIMIFLCCFLHTVSRCGYECVWSWYNSHFFTAVHRMLNGKLTIINNDLACQKRWQFVKMSFI